jgi:hypothetical protein
LTGNQLYSDASTKVYRHVSSFSFSLVLPLDGMVFEEPSLLHSGSQFRPNK